MRRYLTTTACAAVFLSTVPALAQTVNYGSLEDVFSEPVTTSATGKPQKVSEAPVNMEIITQDDIRRSGADNIPDVLQFLVGLDFRRSSFNDPELSIRGYDQPWNPRLLVLVNGRPVYEDFYGDVVWAAIPVQLDEIRQIEVVKGPNSALFGFNAASGVINIVTYDPLYDRANAVTLRTGTQALREGSAVATVHIGDTIGVRMSAGGMEADEFKVNDVPAENAVGLLHPMSGTFNIDGRWQVTPDVQFSLEGGAGTMKRNFPADETPEYDKTDTIRSRLSANTGIGLVDLDFYRNVWQINYLGSQAQHATDIADDFRASDLFKIGLSNSFRIGFEYKYNEAYGEFLSGSTDYYSTYSIGGMWNWDIAPGVSLTNALREDYLQLGFKGMVLPITGQTASSYDTSLNALSFNSGLVYSVSDEDVVRLMAARGFQLPSLDDLGQQIPVPGNSLDLGQPALKPTVVLNFEADYDHTFTRLGATLRSAVFRQNNNGLFGYDAGVPYQLGVNTVYQSANLGSSDETGVEIALKSASRAGFRWNVSYSYATITDHIDSGIAAGVYSTYAGSTPQNIVDFGIGYTLDRWEFDAQGRWQSKFLDYRFNAALGYVPVTIANYVTANAHVGFRVTDGVSLGLTVEQLEAEHLLERASIPVDRRIIVSTTVKF
jgi:iron complex outermembrane receptor protein